MASNQNIFSNRAEITAKALDSVRNNCKMASRVARRWDGDFAESTKIGDTLSVRLPGFYPVRTGSGADPNGYNDSYVQVALQQYGVDLELTSAQLTLNVDDFNKNVLEPMTAALSQKIDVLAFTPTAQFNQFYGKSGTAVANFLPFLGAKAVMATQSACPEDGKLSGALNQYQQAGMLQGTAGYLSPTKEISDQYRTGSIGSAAGIDYFATSNTPNIQLGNWSGTLTVTATLPVDGATALTVAGMTNIFLPGEKFTIAGVYAVNPQGYAQCAELKQFTVTSQVSTTINFTPAMNLTGPNKNISALPISTAAINPWGVDAPSKLAAGNNLLIAPSYVFHEDAIVLGMADLMNTENFGGASCKRIKDDKSGLRMRSVIWYDGYNDKALFRLDVLAGSSLLRQGFGAAVIQ